MDFSITELVIGLTFGVARPVWRPHVLLRDQYLADFLSDQA